MKTDNQFGATLMKFSRIVWAGAAALFAAGACHAAVSADEAQELGKTLTAFGAESAANATGTIPAYTGGLYVAPVTYKAGSNVRPDPFSAERPAFSFDSRGIAKYEGMLTEGAKQLLVKYPEFRISVYPTHRTAAYPQAFLDNTVRNAQRCATANGGVSVTGDGCRGGLPFPIPKTGYEAMWNHLLAWRGAATETVQRDWIVNANGPLMLSEATVYQGYPWYGEDFTDSQPYFQWRSIPQAVPRENGTPTLLFDYLDPVKHPRKAWRYFQRLKRVQAAPEAAYDLTRDTIGVLTFDQMDLFSGAMDRFDFRLVGKKEMIIPYDDYKQVYYCKPYDDLKAHFINPECVRWELHRVWVVEATPKPGKQHIYGKRVFYWDEDTWNAGASDEYDHIGKLVRAGFAMANTWYDSRINSASQFVIYDFGLETYGLYGETADTTGVRLVDLRPTAELTPVTIAPKEGH
jgi:hypothetical protein